MRVFVITNVLRLLMVAFWTGIIFFFLFLPYGANFFPHGKSINLFLWPMIIDEKVIQQFQQETGIKVYVSYYESNAELYAKLRATKGAGYDVIVPTDYAMQQLIDEKLIKKLDKSKLTFLSAIRPFFMGNYFDPENLYSVPYYLGVYGLGRNKDFFKKDFPESSWALIFDKNRIDYKICMTDGPREAVLLAAFYLYGSIEGINDPVKLRAITDLLIEQKQWVQVYSSLRVEELLASGSCPIAVGINADARKVMRENKNIDFSIPKEGSFATMDSFAIIAASNKDDLVYQFINFLYRPDIVAHNSAVYGFCPPLGYMDRKGVACPSAQVYKKLEFFRNVLNQEQIHDLWLQVMSV